jgi:DNA-binding CsgD family transcriptional regulator
MRETRRGAASILPAGFAGVDVARRRRIEAHLRRFARTASAAGWAVGVFDSNQDLLALDTSGTQIDDRVALALLCRVPLQTLDAPVDLDALAERRERLPSAVGFAAACGKGRWLVLVLVLERAAGAWPKAIEAIQAACLQIAGEIADSDFDAKTQITPTPEGPHAFFLLNSDYQVQMEWLPKDDVTSDFAHLVEPEAGRLPLFLEQVVRRLTASWNVSQPATCIGGTAYPLRGLALRVVPMLRTDIYIGVFLNQCDDLHLDAAATAFRISSREREVLHALLDGRSVAEIASSLNLAESTVNDHVARMIAKTNARNRIQMAGMLLGWPAMRTQPNGNGARTSPEYRSAEEDDDPQERRRTRCSWRYQIGSIRPGKSIG